MQMANTTEKSKIGKRIWEFFDDLKLFFREAKARWNADTPKFFRILGSACSWVGGLGFVATALSKLHFLNTTETVEDITTIITFAGGLGAAISKMTFAAGKRVDLQYTEKKQEQAAEKQNV
jgi:hypothetical protein